MTTKNITKGASFTYAFRRINESIRHEFYLEAVTLAESIISDRLLSYVKSRDVRVSKNTSLKQLIDKAKKLNATADSINSEYDLPLLLELDEWRVNRNKCVHSVAKSEPGEPTITIDEFLSLAKKSANDGKDLARRVCSRHGKIKNEEKTQKTLVKHVL
jgi:hypothetical protein